MTNAQYRFGHGTGGERTVPSSQLERSRSTSFQAGSEARGGWNTDGPPESGRRSLSRAPTNETAAGAVTRSGHCQQSLERLAPLPAGAVGAGTAGSPVHHAPEQGRGGAGDGGWADRSVWWSIGPSSGDGRRPRSDRDVTRFEHPPQTRGGAVTAATRSASISAARESNSRPMIGYLLYLDSGAGGWKSAKTFSRSS